MKQSNYLPGITLRSVFAIIFGLFFIAVLSNQAAFFGQMAENNEHVFPAHAFLLFVFLGIFVSLIGILVKQQLLTKQELLCILFAMLFAMPLLTQGFWHRIVSMVTTIPEQGNFKVLDQYNDKLWPHGPNVIPNAFTKGQKGAFLIEFQGNGSWAKADFDKDKSALMPRVVNTSDSQTSTVNIVIPLKKDGKCQYNIGESYLVSSLVRATNLGPDSRYFCRLFIDDKLGSTELFSNSQQADTTFLQKTGFVRQGKYGLLLPRDIQQSITLQFGLTGTGQVEFYSPQFLNVSALYYLRNGRRVISQADYDALPANQQMGLIIKPNNMLSLAGLRYYVTAYIPVKDWFTPIFTYGWLIATLILAALAINVIMRKQWLENERYPVPLARITQSFLDNNNERPFADIFYNSMFWIGLAFALSWALLKGWHNFNSNVPNMAIDVPLAPFFSDPSWGSTFDSNLSFQIRIVFLSLALLMELNILASFVLGYWAYRLQFWFGELTDLKIIRNYPFGNEQAIGSYLAYTFSILFFTRKYLKQVIKTAFSSNNALTAQGEVFSYRTAIMVLAGTYASGVLWAMWLHISIPGILLFLTFLFIVGFVSAKIRAEAGTPWGYFTPENSMYFVSMVGGMSLFGAKGMLVCLISSFMLTMTVFHLIPGAQLEMMHLGKRYKLKPRHILYTVLFGIAGGVVLGGWSTLSVYYSNGTNQLASYNWAFDGKWWWFFSWLNDVDTQTSKMIGQGVETGMEPRYWGYILGAAVTTILATLRQLFAGFWFHPLGYVVAPFKFMHYIWGSMLAALILRWLVLKVGGAATVREKLIPLAVGAFIGSLLSIIFFWVINTYQYMYMELPMFYPGQFP